MLPVHSDRLGLPLLALLAMVIATSPAKAAPGPDQCEAKLYERFIGKPLAELQKIPLPEETRFVCQKCAMTMDIRTWRLTVIYSDKTKIITKLSCE